MKKIVFASLLLSSFLTISNDSLASYGTTLGEDVGVRVLGEKFKSASYELLYDEYITPESNLSQAICHRIEHEKAKDFFRKHQKSAADIEIESIEKRSASLSRGSSEFLNKTLESREKSYEKHKNLLKEYERFSGDEEAIRKELKKVCDLQRDILKKHEKEINPDSKYAITAAKKILSEAEESLDLLNIPIKNREFEIASLKEEIDATSSSTGKYIDRELSISEEIKGYKNLVTKMAHLKSQTLRDLSDVFPKHGGYMWHEDQILSVLGGLSANFQEAAKILNLSSFWQYATFFLELPSIRVPGGVTLEDFYSNELKTLITDYEQKIKEDVFCFETLCGMYSAYRSRTPFSERSGLGFNAEKYDERLSNVLEFLKKDSKKGHRLSVSPSVSREIFKSLIESNGGTYVATTMDAFLENEGGFLGRMIASLERGGFSSWDADRSTLVEMRGLLKPDAKPEKDAISNVLMKSFNILVGRYTNKIVLDQVRKDFLGNSSEDLNQRKQQLFIPL